MITAAAVIAVLLAAVGIVLSVRQWMHGEPWEFRLAVIVTVKWAADLLGVGVGVWWWWRAPANPTGRLLYVASVADIVWIIGWCWPGAEWVREITWATFLTIPCLALAILGWPTGRPDRRTRRVIVGIAICSTVLTLVGMVFNKSVTPSARFPDYPHQLFEVPLIWRILDPIQALVFRALPAAAMIVILVRRRRRVPPAVRPLITPTTVAGVTVAAAYLLQDVPLQLFRSLIPDGEPDVSVPRLIVLLGTYAQIGIVAIGVLVAATRRQRSVALGTRRMQVDLRTSAPLATSSATAAAVANDPTATVRYRRSDGSWIDSTGATLGPPEAGRRQLDVLDDNGDITAAVEVDASLPLPTLLADLLVSTVAARTANERATALADARRLDVLARSRDLVAAADAGRLDLERNLHDGAQQLLVGLALNTGLAARDASTHGERRADATDQVIRQIGQVKTQILDLIDSRAPAALSGGLSLALRSLAAVCPVSASCDLTRDLTAADPLTLDLYLVAGEVIANAVKHSGATRMQLTLSVTDNRVTLVISDDGVGGVSVVPLGLHTRVVALNGRVRIDSPPGRGTTVTTEVPRPGASR